MISGSDPFKAEVNSMEEIKMECKDLEVAVSSLPICLELRDVERSQEETLLATPIEENVSDFAASMTNGFQDRCSEKETDTGADKVGVELKPILEGDKISEEPCEVQDSKCVESQKEEMDPPGTACLTMSLGLYPTKVAISESSDLAGLNPTGSFSSTVGPNRFERDNTKISGLNSIRHRQRQVLPKQPHNQQSNCIETPKETCSQAPIRVARPPGEGRGRNQLLPRYWPRITDQELQQITSADSNSTIIPLFEKMLSASDAGRIGRLVLPKACAEAYFPPISQPEGLPLKIQDISGKDWIFQFRFWPNNNSRMYVLEGVTPCIQSMQLQAGDTVTFSRLDPEGKLVMGYRKAPHLLNAQETQSSTLGSASTSPQILTSGSNDNFSSIASLSGRLSQSIKSASEAQLNGISGQFNLSDTGYGWCKTENAGYKAKEGSFLQSLLVGDKRKRQVNSKSKRLRMDVEDSVEFKISWEEAQNLLRPPPNVVPSIVTIEGHVFEEYEEPPVFGKRTIFTTRKFGPGEDQWAQCDDCGNWRNVPAEVFLPTRWTCADNVWDPNPKRRSCNAPQEVNNEDIDLLLQHVKDDKKQEVAESIKMREPSSGLEALADAATLGENITGSSSPAPTTKHPRHRPGCTCIVCIQPPSGKGPKHKPTCNCNVCMTVKRRFKTLMMRRKKRQSEREAENAAQKKRAWTKEDRELGSRKWQNEIYSLSENGPQQGSLVMAFPGGMPTRINSSNGNGFSANVAITGSFAPRGKSSGDEHSTVKGQIDLNSQPEREEDASRGVGRVSMVSLLQNASSPLDLYLKQQGLASLICPQQLLVPSMSFDRNMVIRKPDGYNGNRCMVVTTSDRTQDESYMTLGIAKFDTATTSLQSFEVIEQKSAPQVSSQSS